MIIKKIEILALLGCIALFLTVCQNPFSSGGNGGFKVVTGTVQRGVEWECWILISNSGKSYELYGEKSGEIKKAGMKVKVIGILIKDGRSYCMQGTPIEVISYQKLD